MRILLTEKDVIKAISNFYKVKEEYIKIRYCFNNIFVPNKLLQILYNLL